MCGETSRLPFTSNENLIQFNVLLSVLFWFFFPSGVLEAQSERDREAFKKAKVLYRSCMNESECCFAGTSCRTLIAGACISICPPLTFPYFGMLQSGNSTGLNWENRP